MTIVKEYSNGIKKISIAQGDEFKIDTDIMVTVIDDLTDANQRKQFEKKYGEDMLGYIERNHILSEVSYFPTPGFKFRANFVFFIQKTKVNTKELFINIIQDFCDFAEQQLLENITFSLSEISKLNFNERKKPIEYLIEYIFSNKCVLNVTLIDNIKYNFERTHNKQLNSHRMRAVDNQTKQKQNGEKLYKDAKINRIFSSQLHEKFDEGNDMLMIQGDLFANGNMINILNEIVDNL